MSFFIRLATLASDCDPEMVGTKPTRLQVSWLELVMVSVSVRVEIRLRFRVGA